MNDINLQDIENWRNKTNERSNFTVILETSLFAIIEVLALVGNIMVVAAVYRNKTLRSITHQYIVTLAIADFLAALVIIPLSIVSSVTGQWPYGAHVCYVQGILLFIWATFSMSIVSITAINRFFCVVKPNIYRNIFTTRNTFIAILITLLICTAFITGLAVGFKASFQFGPHLFCIPRFPTRDLQMSIMLTSFFFFICIPMVTMLVCYFKVYRQVKKHTKKVAPTLGRSKVWQLRQGAEEARITKVVLLVLVVFFISWIPICIVGTVFIVGVSVIPRRVHLMYDYFLVANAASNPIVYGLGNKKFRLEYASILGMKRFLFGRITFSVQEYTGSIAPNEQELTENNTGKKISMSRI